MRARREFDAQRQFETSAALTVRLDGQISDSSVAAPAEKLHRVIIWTGAPLPPLGTDVATPGPFDVILPVRIGYDAIEDKISQAIAALPAQDTNLREVQVYPSSGKLVIGLRLAKTSDSDPNAGQWSCLAAALKIDGGNKSIGVGDLDVAMQDGGQTDTALQQIVAQLKQAVNIDYGVSYQNLLMAANQRLTRPLKDGFRMEGKLSSIQFDKALLLADGMTLALRASGELKILYGM